jgi:hypothetical protein
MKIFLDLDDTLIHSVYGVGNSKRTYATFAEGSYGSIYRSISPELIQFCRNIDPDTSIVTTATYDWVETWNDVFNMGFAKHQMYSRDDFTSETHMDYGRTIVDWNKKSLNLKEFVIVDNYDIHDKWNPSSKHKMCFLGGPNYDAGNWINIKPFTGINDDSQINILQEIKNKITERQNYFLTNTKNSI